MKNDEEIYQIFITKLLETLAIPLDDWDEIENKSKKLLFNPDALLPTIRLANWDGENEKHI